MAASGSASNDPSAIQGIIPCNNTIPLQLRNYSPGKELPPILDELYSRSEVKTEFHALSVLLHNLMLESGYKLKDDKAESFTISSQFVSFCYIHPGCEGLCLTLTCNPVGNQFVAINGLVHRLGTDSDGQFLNTQVKNSDFVNTFKVKPDDSKTVYKNLAKLSRVFKESVAHKSIDIMRTELGLPPLHGLLSLFPEILTNILSYLDVKSLVAISSTCVRLNNLASDNNLWKACFVRDFGGRPNSDTNVSWKEKYIFHYKRRKAELEMQERYRQPAPYIEPNPFAPMNPGLMPGFPGQGQTGFPGIIGGEYDLHPTFPYGPLGGRRGGRHSHTPQPGPRFGEGNPLPGARFDPFGAPGTGNFRPGRGGGMQDFDPDFDLQPRNPLRDPRRPNRGGFGGNSLGGGFGFGGGGFI